MTTNRARGCWTARAGIVRALSRCAFGCNAWNETRRELDAWDDKHTVSAKGRKELVSQARALAKTGKFDAADASLAGLDAWSDYTALVISEAA